MGRDEEKGQPAGLDDFLSVQASEGALESAGEFTLAREKALQKLAGFQLPSPGDWIVKVVQAVVASGSLQDISVQQLRTETQIRFTPGRDWKVDEILSGFYHPQLSCAQDMQQLRSALWALTLGQNRSVTLSPSAKTESLAWNGHHWETAAPATRALLTVSHAPLNDGVTGVWNSLTQAAAANSFASVALSTRCFVCPVPLSVDSRRIDALQNCPRHGFRPASAPLYVGALPAELPPLALPLGTWRWSRPAEERYPAGAGLEPRTPPPDPVAIAFLVTYHYSGVSSETVRPAPVASTCNWVLDGAVIAQEPFDIPQSSCALAVWLSAQGLSSDLSGFGLADQPERRERLATAARVLAESLDPQAPTSFAIPLQAAQDGSTGSNILMGTGAILLALLPMAFPLGGTVLGIGWLMGRSARVKRQVVLDDITVGLAQLSKAWCGRYGSA